MAVTAALVKELRERTGAGMMECKKALVETNGDIEVAIEEMRKSGMAKADKKAGRIAADGLVAIASANGVTAIVEVNSETDFVAKGEAFKSFVSEIANLVASQRPADVAALNELPLASGESVDTTRRALISKLGENLSVRRFEILEGDIVASYTHGARIASVVSMTGGDEELGRQLAMHVAASNPQFLNADAVPGDVLAKEKEILIEQAADSGKPADIIEKMVQGRLRKHLAEITFYGQPFVMDSDVTVEKLLKQKGAQIDTYVRFEVGEGIEKEELDFAAEVAAQVAG
ncbi:MAG: elongation factor Ts [Gammaproteobacteria bacterium]|jgi:elongation factor Ts